MRFIGQGKVYVATRDAQGNPGGFRWLFDVSQLQLQPKSQTIDHQESHTGRRLTDVHVITQTQMMLQLTLDDWDPENIALALYGTHTQVVSGTVTAEQLPAALVDNDYAMLANPGVSSVVVNDSAGTPVALVEGTDYQITNADLGMIQLLNTSTFMQPFTVDYSYAQYDKTAAFETSPPERWLRFNGINLAEQSKPIGIDLYRVVLDLPSQIDMINTQVGTFQLGGEALYDSLKEGNTALGQFGRVLQL